MVAMTIQMLIVVVVMTVNVCGNDKLLIPPICLRLVAKALLATA